MSDEMYRESEQYAAREVVSKKLDPTSWWDRRKTFPLSYVDACEIGTVPCNFLETLDDKEYFKPYHKKIREREVFKNRRELVKRMMEVTKFWHKVKLVWLYLFIIK